MMEISVFDAKNRLSALLDDVERGHEMTITRRGKPVARLVGIGAQDHASTIVADSRALRDDIDGNGGVFTRDDIRAMRKHGWR